MDETYLVTGGAGFIGSYVVDRLVENGKNVMVLDIKSWEEAKNIHHHKNNIEYVEGDICDFVLMFELGKKCTHVIHLAAIVSVPYSIENPIESNKVNIDGTLNVFEAAVKGGVKRVVYASSAAVYGNTNSVPVHEDHSLKPMSPYGIHKCVNEFYGRYYADNTELETIGLRYFNVYGKRQSDDSPYSGFISILRKRLLNNDPLTVYGDGEQTRDFVHVEDVVDANMKALSKGVSGSVYNIGTAAEVSINELISLAEQMGGKKIERDDKPIREGDIKRSCADISKAVNELEYKPSRKIDDELALLLQE